MIHDYLLTCLTIREYHTAYLRTGDLGYAWGIADCIAEIELIERGAE